LPPPGWTTSTAPAEPVMYPPYTCVGDAPDHEAAMPLVAALSKAPGRLT
jgi:hypothetical protein